MDDADGMLCEVGGQVFKCYRNGDLFRRLKTGEYRLVINSGANDGYSQIKCNKKLYKYHRIIYFAFNPTFNIHDASLLIDHMDGNKLNNSLDNLRAVSNQENHHNRSTAKGYYFYKKYQKYMAYITLNNKKTNLGYFNTRWEARQAYLNAIPIYHPTCPVHLYTNDEDDCPFKLS